MQRSRTCRLRARYWTLQLFIASAFLLAAVSQAEAISRAHDAAPIQADRSVAAALRGQSVRPDAGQHPSPVYSDGSQRLAQRVAPVRRSKPPARPSVPGLIIRLKPGKLISGAKKRKKHRITKKLTTTKRKRTKRARIPARQGRSITRRSLPAFRANEILVMLNRRQPEGVDSALARTYRLVLLERLPLERLRVRIVRYRIRGRRNIISVIAQVRANPRVLTVQRNYLYRFNGKISSRKRTKLQYALDKLGVQKAHAMSTGRGVAIAIIDSGIDTHHPDLKGSIVHSFNAVTDRKYATHAHGTAIAGIIGARGRIKGVAPQARLLSVRAFYMSKPGKPVETTTFILLRAFDWSLSNGARIFNLSFAGPKDRLVERMLNKAHAEGCVLVAAAGNGGRRAAPAYPAAYKTVIAITATDQADRLFQHANRGTYLAVAAPGVDVLVLRNNKAYGYSSGTSFAAAHISGVIALMLEQVPNASSAMLKDVMFSTALDLGPKGHDRQFGAGRADAFASLQALMQQGQGQTGQSQ